MITKSLLALGVLAAPTTQAVQNYPTLAEMQQSPYKYLQKTPLGGLEVGDHNHRDEQIFHNVHSNPKPMNEGSGFDAVDVGGAIHSSKVGYEIFLRSFADSNGDGVGDLNGIDQNIPYLKSLGVDMLWLTPWVAAPSTHKYDALSYYDIDPEYGTMNDFKKLVKDLKDNGIELIMDIAFNHTSKWSPWFIDFLHDRIYGNQPGDIDRSDWYRYSPTMPLVNGKPARGWYPTPTGQGYYFAAFGPYMPDLKLDNSEVSNELMHVIDYWKQLGVSGFRIDAPKEGFDVALGDELPGTPVAQVKEKNRKWWLDFVTTIESYWPNTYVVGENWTGSEDELRELIEPFSEFSFPWKNKIIDSVKKGNAWSYSPPNEADRLSYVAAQFASDIDFYKEKHPSFLSTNFLSNHDRPRIRNSVVNSGPEDDYKAFVAANMMMALPGMPMIYYGDELLMDGYSKSGVQAMDTMYRLPFPWTKNPSDDPRNTKWVNNPMLGSMDTNYDLYQEFSAKELMSDQGDNILNHYKKLIEFRHKYGAILQEGVYAANPGSNAHRVVEMIPRENGAINPNIFALAYNTFSGDEYIVAVNLAKGWAGGSGGTEIAPGKHLELLWSVGTTYNNLPETDNTKFSMGPKSMAFFKVIK